MPEIVLLQVDRALSASEPDPELSAPLEASAGINLGLDYLPGSVTFDPVASPRPDAATASRVVLFDALVTNWWWRRAARCSRRRPRTCGLCEAPEAAMERLLDRVVRRPVRAPR